jgi:hypothetical protein
LEGFHVRKLALLAGVGVILAGSIGAAEAQPRWRYGYHGGWGGPYAYGHRGGAVAAGLVGGAILGGLVAAAATPAYSYPAYPYGYGYAPVYDYGYSRVAYPVASPYYGGYYYSPPVETVVYRTVPAYRPRVVYRPAPVYRARTVYRTRRVVARPAPVYRGRVVYREAYPYRAVRVRPY